MNEKNEPQRERVHASIDSQVKNEAQIQARRKRIPFWKYLEDALRLMNRNGRN